MALKVIVDDGNINDNYRCGRQGLIATLLEKTLGTGEEKSPRLSVQVCH